MTRIIWAIQAAVFYLLTGAIAVIPRRFSRSAGRLTGKIMYRLLARRRDIAIDNIRQALPFMKRHSAWTGSYDTAEEIALATFINLGISIVEVCRMYHGRGAELFDSMSVQGLDNFQRAKEKDIGVLCVSGHCGNWELGSLSFKRHLDLNVWAVARKQNNPYLNTIVEKMRMGYGNKVIYTKSALKQMLGVIKNNGVIGMLTDQAAGEQNGILIDFLGRKAWALKAPVVIAHKTGVPVVPVLGYREDDRHVLVFLPEYTLCGDRTEVGIAQDIQSLSRYLEEFVCAHPADWYWVHRRWKRAGQSSSGSSAT
ncbi:MAG: lysophospholipid acyltransferase family protein [Desulfuromonadaceae bacterium]|nr:lysophospholipid acyltransferase family protein [Desulfuromonadaceae bacterium]